MVLQDINNLLNIVEIKGYDKNNKLTDSITTCNATLPGFSYFLSLLLTNSGITTWPGESSGFVNFNTTVNTTRFTWKIGLGHPGFTSSGCTYNPSFTVPSQYLTYTASHLNPINITGALQLKDVSQFRFVQQSANCGTYTANIGGIQLLFVIDYGEANIDVQPSGFTGYCQVSGTRFVAITEFSLYVNTNNSSTSRMVAYTRLPVPIYKYPDKKIEVLWTIWFKPHG